MHRTLATLADAALLLGASPEQAWVVDLSDSELDKVAGGGSITSVNGGFNSNSASFNGSFNDSSTNNGNFNG